MSVAEERASLSARIQSLKQELDEIDLQSLKEVKAIDARLNQIADVYIQIKQFISRRGVNDWNGWGPPLWNDIERNEAALKRQLERLERENTKKVHVFDRRVSRFSLAFMAIAAIAAAFSACFAYLSIEKVTRENTEETQKVEIDNSSPEKKTPLNKAN